MLKTIVLMRELCHRRGFRWKFDDMFLYVLIVGCLYPVKFILSSCISKFLAEFEYILGQAGAVNTKIEEDPKQRIKDKLFTDLGSNDW